MLPAFKQTALVGIIDQAVEIRGIITAKPAPQDQVVTASYHLQGVQLDTAKLFDSSRDHFPCRSTLQTVGRGQALCVQSQGAYCGEIIDCVQLPIGERM